MSKRNIRRVDDVQLALRKFIEPKKSIESNEKLPDLEQPDLDKIRDLVREVILQETRYKQMAKPEYRNLDNHIASSSFMNSHAGEGDYEFDENGRHYNTDASISLRDSLNSYFDNNLRVLVSAIVTADEDETTSQSARPIKAASYFFNNGMHYIQLTISQLPADQTFMKFFGNRAASTIAQVIRHELLHMNQFLRYSKGHPTSELYKKFTREYSEAKEKGWSEEPYHTFDTGFSERETFSHQIADELIATHGSVKSIEILKRHPLSHSELTRDSQSYRDVTKDRDSHSDQAVLDMIRRSIQYAKGIGAISSEILSLIKD